VLEIMPFLADGFSQEVCQAPTNVFAALALRFKLRTADIVILQKELVSRPVLWLIRSFSRKFVYDFDDAVYVRLKADGSCRSSRKRQARFATICRAADLVLAGNPILETAAREAGASRIAVLPTAVALPESKVPAIRSDDAPVCIGWIGTDVNLPYLESLEPVFLALQQEEVPFKMRVMAGKPPCFARFSASEFVPWSPQAELDFLAGLDIGLMPLADNEHSRGKCAYKALQYMSMGKPVVVDDVGINATWTAGAGFAVASREETAKALRLLLTDAALRTSLGATGRQRVVQEFSRPVVVARLRELLNDLARVDNSE
jgi:glycosyltransferase involved in cell wall biosynthesis